MTKKNKGFMIYEMIIIIVIIAIIAAIAIPGLLRARLSANEGSTIGTLRSLTTAQAQFQASSAVDQDQDGTGEYGLLGELTGATSRRGNTEQKQLPPLTPSFMSISLTPTPEGHSEKSGYAFRLFLPGPVGQIITDGGKVAPLDYENAKEDEAIQQQENRWIAYAWPIVYRNTGIRAFVCDQSGEVCSSANTTNKGEGIWEGNMSMPKYKDAMSASEKITEVEWTNIAIKGGAVNSEQIWLPSY